MQDPETFLNALDLTLPCVVHPNRTAVLDPDHRIFVNREIYFVSSPEAVLEFKEASWRYTGPVTDPVTGARFQPDETSPRREHDGRVYYFSSGKSLTQFAANPESYTTPMLGMVEKTK